MQSVKTNHFENCKCMDCLESQSSQKYNPAFYNQINYADQGYGENDNDPGYYLGSTLKALKKVDLWSLPGASIGGKKVRTINPGETVGVVDTYVLDKINPTQIWWRFKDGTYTPHFTGYFDKELAAVTSSGAAHVAAATKANEINLAGALPDFSSLLPSLKWVLIGVVVIVVGLVVLKFK